MKKLVLAVAIAMVGCTPETDEYGYEPPPEEDICTRGKFVAGWQTTAQAWKPRYMGLQSDGTLCITSGNGWRLFETAPDSTRSTT